MAVGLEDVVTQEIADLLRLSLPDTLSRTLSLSLPAVLTLWLPGSLRQNLGRSLSGVLGRALTHSLAPSIFLSIKASAGHSVVYPVLSDRLRGEQGTSSSSRGDVAAPASDGADAGALLGGQPARYAQPDVLRSALYYMDTYASYYSDYYSDIFTSSTADFLNQKKSALLVRLFCFLAVRCCVCMCVCMCVW